jgi:hypothetical protein
LSWHVGRCLATERRLWWHARPQSCPKTRDHYARHIQVGHRPNVPF